MKVLWIYFDVETGNQLHYNHGVGQIDACLRQAGHDTVLEYYQKPPTENEALSVLKKHQPDAVFFPVNTHQWMFARRYARWVKKHSTAFTVVGGIHAILDPESVIQQPGVDAVCIGEGEQAAVELLDALAGGGSPDAVEGIWLKTSAGKIVRNRFRPLIEDLDSLPVSMREIWDYQQAIVANRFELTVMGGRGCPFKCTYCANSARREIYRGHGRYVRMCSPQRLIETIAKLEQAYSFQRIFIEDDVFIFKHSWAEQFCEMYKERFNYPFQAYVRVEFCTKEILRTMREAGCFCILIGVEAGNEELRAKMLNRKMTNESIIKVFRWADELGLQTWNFNIMGFPEETEQTVEDLFQLNRTIRPNKAQISLFYPYPNTRLYDLCKERGYITGSERPTYFEESILSLPTISKRKLTESFWRFRDMALQIRAEKEQKGYFDFTTQLPLANVDTSDPQNVKLEQVQIGGVQEMVLFEHPRSTVTIKALVKPGSVFRTIYALDPLCLTWGGEGVRFILSVKDKSGTRELFNRYLDPKADPELNRWHELEIDLDGLDNQEVEFIFRTEPNESGDLTGAWSVWGRPHLALKGFEQCR